MFLKRYISILCILVAIALAYGLDRWLDNQRNFAFRTTDITPLILWTLAIHFLLIAVFLGLFWIIFRWKKPDTSPGLIILIIGIATVIYPALQIFVPAMPSIFTSFNSILSYTGIFISFLGILKLLKPAF
ncbi:MAG: hypothetical protein IBX69_18515 [Anaerolineales bacterium]|nr:hypothetical protein [Anaerolineales bacterium]